MDSEVARLVGLLEELATLLDAHSRTHWSQWVAKDAALLRAGDRSGVTHFLSAFGGMGSLNDIVLDPRSEDDRFDSLKDEAWTLATSLKNEGETG